VDLPVFTRIFGEPSMLLRRFYDDKLAQASYMVGCQACGEAIVVDPHRDTDLYLRAAADEEMTIRYVGETHIHADFLSGSRQLAKRTGATLLLSDEGGEDWRYRFADSDGARLLRDGDQIELGKVSLRVLHTPGHTPEHVSFLVTDGAATTEPLGILSGDFVFVGDVGRPDLLERAAGVANTMEAGARQLYRSLERFRTLPDHLQVWPGHGAGSACGKALGAVPSSTVGYEKLVSWALAPRSEDEFVEEVLRDQPEPPAYFAVMKRMNRDGPPLLEGLPVPELLGPEGLASVLREGATVVDTRSRGEFSAGHAPGTLNIPLREDFPTWAGSLLSYDRPLYLLAAGEGRAREAARDLTLIGQDRIEGYFDASALEAWERVHGPLETTAVVDWSAAERAARDEGAMLLDVRRTTEWNEAHAPGATHIHLGELPSRLDELPRDRPILLYCRTANRSAIAASILQAVGFADVRNVEGGITERLERRLPTVAA
jgi:hydroxyacylglutathione hydrolase